MVPRLTPSISARSARSRKRADLWILYFCFCFCFGATKVLFLALGQWMSVKAIREPENQSADETPEHRRCLCVFRRLRQAVRQLPHLHTGGWGVGLHPVNRKGEKDSKNPHTKGVQTQPHQETVRNTPEMLISVKKNRLRQMTTQAITRLSG